MTYPTAKGQTINPNFLLPPTRVQRQFLVLPDSSTKEVYFGEKGRSGQIATKDITQEDYLQTLVKDATNYAAGLTDYISITLRDRAYTSATSPDLKFKFLVNPNTLQMNRQTVDGESMTRAGMQSGVWGDTLDISLAGQTAGQYFAGTLVDTNRDQSLSYTNLVQLMAVYENNGMWFEGEVAAQQQLGTTPWALKQIQLQADVILRWQNFIWHGCFTEMSLDEDATHPYICKFSLSFMAWKERFSTDSPWLNSLPNNQYFGHSYENYPVARRQNRGGAAGPPQTLAMQAAVQGNPASVNPTFSPGIPAPAATTLTPFKLLENSTSVKGIPGASS